MPLRPPGTHHVACRLVDGHRGIEDEPQLEQLLHHGVPPLTPLRSGLLPQATRLTEAVVLVVVVVVVWKVLHRAVVEQRFGQSVPVLHRRQPESGGVQHVHARDSHLAEVGRGPHSPTGRLFYQCRHDLGVVRDELETVHALVSGPPHPIARVVRREDRASVPTRTRARVHEDPGRHDRVLGRALLLVQCPIDPVAGARLPYRSDAVCQPELVHVLRSGPLRASSHVAVQVHEPRQHVHPLGIELEGRITGPPVSVDRRAGRTHAAHRHDAIALDHDVHRTARRCPGAVHDRRSTDDEPLERAVSFARTAVGAGRDALVLRRGDGRYQQ